MTASWVDRVVMAVTAMVGVVTVETVTATPQVAAFRVEAPEGATAVVAEITIAEAAVDMGAALAPMAVGVDRNLKEDTLRVEETAMAVARATVAVEVTVVLTAVAAPVDLPSGTKRILCSWEA